METPNKKIESHSSYNTNKLVNMWKAEIDALGLQASNSMHLSNIIGFFNAVEQWYIGVKDVLGNKDDLEKLRQSFLKLLDLIEENPQYQTRRSLKMLLRITKQFYSDIITGLQKHQYFFRFGVPNVKGLKNVRFFEGSVFKAGRDRGSEEDGMVQEEMG